MDYLADTFGTDTALCERVLAAAKQNHEQLQLLTDVVRHLSRPTSLPVNGISKKRKLEEGHGDTSVQPVTLDRINSTKALSVPDISFVVPVRKKLSLDIYGPGAGQTTGGGISITGKDVSYTFSWSEVAQVLCLPVPEKAARQHNFVILLEGSQDEKNKALGLADDKQFVFTLNETGYTGDSADAREGDTWVSLVGRTINAQLVQRGKQVVLPTAEEFESAIPQSHRKGEAAFHVKAHLGSKDGYLFFLPTGILFGFRKPVQHYAFESITSISYTSVLQRTFNLVISTFSRLDNDTGEPLDSSETEFSMLDQADFAGIDAYIKRHGLNDASMAKERQAKKLNVNGKKGKGEEEEGGEESELQKAEQELQDQEDEEEEDYDPSGGESEGEGEDSDEEGGGDEGVDVEEVEGGEEEEEEE